MALQLTIDKLKYGYQYYHWAEAVRAYLEVEDLWDVVQCGAFSFFGEFGLDDGTVLQTLKKDNQAKLIILCLVDPKVVSNVKLNCTSYELWNYLEVVGPRLPDKSGWSYTRWTVTIVVVAFVLIAISDKQGR